MSAKDRAAVINKLFKYCKKEYQFIPPPSDRTVLEHVVYSCCLEDSTHDAADEGFARLQDQYFDWNEVRVSTAEELAELFKNHKNAIETAVRVKKALHGIFETYYQFELDFLKKENLGKAVTQFSKMKGVSPFVVSYTAQMALGGHSIPIDKSMLLLLSTLGVVSEADAKKFKVTGLERVIPKSKGVEFANLTHQLAVAYYNKPFGKEVREVLISLVPDARERFPKRASRAKPASKKATAAKEADAKKPAAKKPAAKKPAAKPAKASKKTATKAVVKKKSTKKTSTAKKVTGKGSVKKKTTKKAASKPVKKAAKKKTVTKKTSKKKSSTKQLKKKKPR